MWIVMVQAERNPKDVAQLLAAPLKMDPDVLKVSSLRRPYGVLPMNETIVKEQQNVADTFFKIGLIPKQIQVSKLVANNSERYPNGVSKA